MMSRIVVFDFDKTLSVMDTFNQFLYFLGKRSRAFLIRKSIYFFIRILRKIRLISNLYEKKLGIRVFNIQAYLSDQMLLKDFSLTIQINNTVKELLMNRLKDPSNKLIICSASPENYIEILFPETQVIGMKLKKMDNNLIITQHPFKRDKLTFLKNMGVERIDELFTDSISDKYLAEISDKVFIVKGDQILECRSYSEYLSHI